MSERKDYRSDFKKLEETLDLAHYQISQLKAEIARLRHNGWLDIAGIPDELKDGRPFYVYQKGWMFWNAAVDRGPDSGDGPDPREEYVTRQEMAYFSNGEDLKPFIMDGAGNMFSARSFGCVDGDLDEFEDEWPEKEYPGGPFRITRYMIPTPPETTQKPGIMHTHTARGQHD